MIWPYALLAFIGIPATAWLDKTKSTSAHSTHFPVLARVQYAPSRDAAERVRQNQPTDR